MDKGTHFVIEFNSRCDATLFCKAVQKQLKKECLVNGFTEFESVGHRKGNGGLIATVRFKDPMTVEEAKTFSEFDSEWKLCPSSRVFDDSLKLEWS